ncbi:ferredoxin [Nocardia sp. NPDC051321]|uniref:ferredoxin n=1 Tax=Nocardia sp. NPDC051321 TaxID=3364323 RepID=UPI00379869DB
MRLSVDRERCCGAGMCALTAPGVFDQDQDSGRVVLLAAEPPAHFHKAARLAIQVCPCLAITEG